MTTRRLSGGLGQVQGVEKLQLLGCCCGEPFYRALTDLCLVALDTGQQVERGARAGAVPLGLQAHTHDAVEHEGQEADQGVGADAVWQSMVNWRDLDVGFQNAEAALDIGQLLVARDGVRCCQVRCIGDQRELAIEEFRA